MPSVISNPASFSSVRTAFNAEGYGISDSFFAYRQGGSIVPATSTFNGIGAGTEGDPLQLSQFSGFSVPTVTGTVYLENVGLNASSQAYNDQPTSSLAGVRMLDSGEFQGIINDQNQSGWYTLFNWRTGGTTSPWSFKATQTFAIGATSGGTTTASGDFTTGWVAASTLPEWYVATNTNSFQRSGTIVRIFTLELALTSDTSNVLATASISLQSASVTNAGEEP
jgi:hypothetical protein